MFKTPRLYHKHNLISLLPSVLSPSASHGFWICSYILDRNQALGGHLSLFYFCHVPHKDAVCLNSSRFCTSNSNPIFCWFLLENLKGVTSFERTHQSGGINLSLKSKIEMESDGLSLRKVTFKMTQSSFLAWAPKHLHFFFLQFSGELMFFCES